jgi:DNA (cytosine-5)-methyltransferase 1
MGKLRALDLFCCAGGATKGLQRAGFHVTGVDIKPQPRYCGDDFHQADALTYPLDGFDFIWASPPCQKFSITAKLHKNKPHRKDHPDLIEPVRQRLLDSGLPYVIENVEGAPLFDALCLCGTMFGLRVYRHRLFEANFFLMVPGHPVHRATTRSSRTYSRFSTGSEFICVAGHNFRREDAALAMGIDWPMRREEMAEAIPPAYSEFIGRAAIAHLQAMREAA